MYQIKIDGQVFDRIPASIDDVSIGRFVRFRNFDHKNDYQMLCWALDSQTTNFKHTQEVENQLAKVFQLIEPVRKEIYAFMKDQSKFDVPDSIDVMGYDVKLKKGLLNDLPYWPYVVTKKIILDEKSRSTSENDYKSLLTDRIPEIIAHYLYSEVTKSPYSEAKAGEFVEIVNDLPMKQCIQLGNFFLQKLTGLSLSSKRNSFRE